MVDISPLFDPGAAYQGPTATPTQNLISNQSNTKAKSIIPSFEDNPLAAVGLVLQETGAGILGRPSPLDALHKRQAQLEEMRLRKFTLGFNAFQQAYSMLKHVPPDQRNEYMRKTGNNLRSFLGEGAGETFAIAADTDFTTLPSDIQHFPGAEENGKRGILVWNKAKGERMGFIALRDIPNKGPLPVKLKVERDGKVYYDAVHPRTGKRMWSYLVGQAKEPKSSILDARGKVKPDVSTKLNKLALQRFPNFRDDVTGELKPKSPDAATKAQAVAREASKLLEEGRADNIDDALDKAFKTLGLPEKRKEPEVKVSADQRKRLQDQNNDISRVLELAKTVENPELGTGIISRFKAFTEGLVVGSDVGVLFPDTAAVRQQLRQINQEMKRVFVNNPRYTQAEQSLVADSLVNPDDWFKNPSEAVRKWEQLKEFLRKKQAANAALLEGRQPGSSGNGTKDNPFNMPAEKSALQKDKYYQTSRGTAKWDGEKFVIE